MRMEKTIKDLKLEKRWGERKAVSQRLLNLRSKKGFILMLNWAQFCLFGEIALTKMVLF